MSTDSLSAVASSLTSVELIPDVLPASFTPSLLFTVVWPNGKQADLGNELTRAETLDEPDIVFTSVGVPESNPSSNGQEATYTLVMLDPDAPSRAEPKFKEFRHWVITGLKAPENASTETSCKYVLKTRPSTTPYRPPGPPPGSGLHRYAFLLFQEPANAPLDVPTGAPEYGAALEQRRSWSGIKFGEHYGLKLIGANYFLVRSTE